MVGLSTFLMVRAEYGNYTLAGCLGGQHHRHGDLRADPRAPGHFATGSCASWVPWVISVLSMSALVAAVFMHAPEWLLFISGCPRRCHMGLRPALDPLRWTTILDKPGQLTAAALESAVDEFGTSWVPCSPRSSAPPPPGRPRHLHRRPWPVGGFGFLLSRRSPSPPSLLVECARVRHPQMPSSSSWRTYIGMGTTFGAMEVSMVSFAEGWVSPRSAASLALFSIGSLSAALVYGTRTWRRPTWQLFAIGVILMAIGMSFFPVAFNIWTMAAVISPAPHDDGRQHHHSEVRVAMKLTEGLTWMSTSINLGASLGTASPGAAIGSIGARGACPAMASAGWAIVDPHAYRPARTAQSEAQPETTAAPRLSGVALLHTPHRLAAEAPAESRPAHFTK